MFQVRKKNGELQEFDKGKIINAVIGAGGTPEEAEAVFAQVEAGLASLAVDNVVDSSAIKGLVLDALRSSNPTVAASFEAYKKA